MAKNKTTETASSVDDFINAVTDKTKRDDSYQIISLMQDKTGYAPKIWGSSIIGFGSYHYKYESGHEGDAPLTGFSPRTSAISLYITDFPTREALLENLGKYKAGKGCIYIKKLKDVNIDVLSAMISDSVAYLKSKYVTS
jgi:hypothetical protein